ncbi:winged helix-turn-helix domain-containing protein [Shewanella sp. 30m-9]
MMLSFSEFSIDSEALELYIDGNGVAIDERNITLLLTLAQAYPEHCSKQDCLSLIWPDTVVSDMSLSKLVSDTRKLFSQAGYQGPLIHTVHGRGYRLEQVLGKQLMAQAELKKAELEQAELEQVELKQAELAQQSQQQALLHKQRANKAEQKGTVERAEDKPQPAASHPQRKAGLNWLPVWWENVAKLVIAFLLLLGLILQFWHVSRPSHEHGNSVTLEHNEPVKQLVYSEQHGSIGRVLWVDDHPENNLLEKAFFEQKGIGVYNTVTSEEALMLLSMYSYQAVISDMGRHGDSLAGLKLLQSIRASGNKTPFYLYTYVESAGVVDAIYKSGGQAVVLDSESLYNLVLAHFEPEKR